MSGAPAMYLLSSGLVSLAGMGLSCSPQPGSLVADAASADSWSPIAAGASRLLRTNGAPTTLNQIVVQRDWTVLVFFSRQCPTMAAHDARLLALFRRYTQRGVGFWLVSSEQGSTLRDARSDVAGRGYPFPMLVDANGTLAQQLGARYATQALVLDGQGRVRYSGGIDSDKTHLSTDATPYLANALDALLAGAQPPPGDHRALGCGLRLP